MKDQRQRTIRYRLIDPAQGNHCFYTIEARWNFDSAKRSAEQELEIYKKDRPLAYVEFEYGPEEEECVTLTCITCKEQFVVEKTYDDPDKEGYCSLECMDPRKGEGNA